MLFLLEMWTLLCAYYAAVLIDRNTRLARPSVRLSVPYRLLTGKLRGVGKPKFVWTFPGAGNTGVAI